jgi:hypothetical protein
MIATFGAKFDADIRVSSVNNFNHPIAAEAYRYIVFGLAGYHTIAAANAFPGINSHCISHSLASFLGSSFKKVTKFPRIPVPPMIGSVITLVINSVSFTPRPKA